MRLDSLGDDQPLKYGFYSMLGVAYYLCECIFVSVYLSPSMAFTGVAIFGFILAVTL